MATVRYKWTCPVCGMTISSRWKPKWGLVEPIFCRKFSYYGTKIEVEDTNKRPSGWFVYVKSVIGWIAEKFGWVRIKEVVRTIIPDYICDRISYLEDQLRGLLDYITALERENHILTAKIERIERHNVSWGGMLWRGKRVQVEEVEVEQRKELGW